MSVPPGPAQLGAGRSLPQQLGAPEASCSGRRCCPVHMPRLHAPASFASSVAATASRLSNASAAATASAGSRTTTVSQLQLPAHASWCAVTRPQRGRCRRCCTVSAGKQQVILPGQPPGEGPTPKVWVPQPARVAAPAAPLAEPDEEDVLIELRDVHKAFGSKQILRGASMKIRRGEAVGIIGGSGTGKSTTLRLMAGLLSPDKGEVLIRGQLRRGLLGDQPELSAQLHVGMVFQSGALFDSLTVGENVGFLLYEHSKLAADRIQRLVRRALAAVGLSGVDALYPSELSGGMKKRVALARAIITDDEHDQAEQVIMYDEPTAGLDPVASTVVEDLVRSLHVGARGRARPGTPGANGTNGASPVGGIASYIVVTHQHSTIRRAVDRLIFLHEGMVVWEGTVEEFDNSDEPIVRQFASGSLNGPITYV